MKVHLTTICRISVILAFLLLGFGAASVAAQTSQVTVTYDPLPADWREIQIPPYTGIGDFKPLLGLYLGPGDCPYGDETCYIPFDNVGKPPAGPTGRATIRVSIRPRQEASIFFRDSSCTGEMPLAQVCETGETTLDGYPALWDFEHGNSFGDTLVYQVDIGLPEHALFIDVGVCAPYGEQIINCGENVDAVTEQARAVVNGLHFQLEDDSAPSAAPCQAQISYPSDLRPGDSLAPDVSFWDSNLQAVEPLSFSMLIDGLQTNQATWSGRDTLVEVDYICPDGKPGHDTFTIHGSGPGVIPTRVPTSSIPGSEPPDSGSILVVC